MDIQSAVGRVEEMGGMGGAEPHRAGRAASSGEQAAVAAIAERHSFSRILLSPDMASEHVPNKYLSALQAL